MLGSPLILASASASSCVQPSARQPSLISEHLEEARPGPQGPRKLPGGTVFTLGEQARLGGQHSRVESTAGSVTTARGGTAQKAGPGLPSPAGRGRCVDTGQRVPRSVEGNCVPSCQHSSRLHLEETPGACGNSKERAAGDRKASAHPERAPRSGRRVGWLGPGLIRVQEANLRRKGPAGGVGSSASGGSRTRRPTGVHRSRGPGTLPSPRPGSCTVPSSTARGQCWLPLRCADGDTEATPRPSSQAELRDTAAPPPPQGLRGPAGRMERLDAPPCPGPLPNVSLHRGRK